MRRSINARVRLWVESSGRKDLLTEDGVDVSESLYEQVLAEAREQHPEEPADFLEDRALYRILTHHEWTPKTASGLTKESPSATPVLYRMMEAAAESARGAASSATIAALEASTALQLAERAELAANEAKTYAKRDMELAEGIAVDVIKAKHEIASLAKRDLILKFIIIGLLLFGLGFLVTRPAHAQTRLEGQGAEVQKMVRAETKKPADSPPILTSEQKFRIRDLQHKYDDLRVQMVKLEMDKMKLERQITDVLSTINGAAFDIARESKVPTDKWNLDIDALQWVARKK